MSDLLVIGVGGAGKHIAYRTQACVGGRGLAVNTESESLRSSPLPEKLLISSRCYADEATCQAGWLRAPFCVFPGQNDMPILPQLSQGFTQSIRKGWVSLVLGCVLCIAFPPIKGGIVSTGATGCVA